ncbi:hypothetical protein [Micromonospora fulviviridis]|uniref:Uncharacterized protein n=1 Tax=Micromonospora fulviviridis TaxID=47860 RepID=A0ABV2VWG9_9ACTN
MTTAIIVIALIVIISALLIADLTRRPATRTARRPRPATTTRRPRPAGKRATSRKPIPGPIPGTVIAHRSGKCARCAGPVLTGEAVYPTRSGWNCTGCSLH